MKGNTRNIQKRRGPAPPPKKAAPRPRAKSRSIVGVKPSIKGLNALVEFARNVPPDLGLAFFLTKPSKKSDALVRTIAGKCALPVVDLVDGTKVKPNFVYIVPPHTSLTVEAGVLRIKSKDKPGATVLGAADREKALEGARIAAAILATSREPCMILDHEFRVQSANQAYHTVFDTLPVDVDGLNLFDLQKKHWNIDRLRTLLQSVLPNDSFFDNFEVTLTLKDGSRHTFLLNARSLKQHVNSILLGIQDITEMQQFQSDLSQSEARKDAVLKSALDAIIIVDREGKILESNPASEKILKMSQAEMVGNSLIGMLVKEDNLDEPHDGTFSKVLASGEWPTPNRQTERTLRRADGTEIEVELSIVPVPGSEPALFTVFLRDITRRKRDEAQLRDAQSLLADRAALLEQTVLERTAKLREMVSELEYFSYTISHDMRTPLRAMQGFAELLLTEGKNQTPEDADYLNRIMSAARRMDDLIRDALQYTKILHGELALTPVDPTALLTGILESYPTLQPPNAQIEIKGPLPRVVGNEACLTQCFSNLLTNAVKFVPPGQAAKVEIFAEKRGRQVRLWFKDNGIGIEPEYHQRIFGIFQQLSKQYEGTGIGLALVRKVAERMGGQAGVESTLGEGSSFWLEFKLA